MTEVDYQLALLLQKEYEQERIDSRLAKKLQEEFERENIHNGNKSNNTNLSDCTLARNLQEQYQTELEVERPGHNLVYEDGNCRNRAGTASAKSLTDPSWEIIDPTPDIHTLFTVFSDRFFWNQLGSVTVAWSKKMTTCAGICSYQGRAGLCMITLSEPLLKLRPRKDLVETLLHEMIHAYLFVTNNNRDRDGHGPEFHKHMKRINDEVGTNITVYHNFYDEVNLYKTHWWRCNGPCQIRRPFFGLVRRAQNRAPGPNDFWWAEHTLTCGGTFIKVKDPESERKPKKSKSATSTSKSPDIRKFFPTNSVNKPAVSIVQIVNTSDQSNTKINKLFSSTNIFGFSNLNDENSCKNNHTTIIKQKDKTSTNSGKKLGSGSSVTNGDYSVVRNHWLNKFSNTNNSESVNKNIPKKRRPSDVSGSALSASKKLRTLSEPTSECPVCSRQISHSEINLHLDDCLKKDDLQDCYVCGTSVPVNDLKKHLSSCLENSFEDDVFDSPPKDTNQTSYEETKKCDICQNVITKEDYDTHVSNCLHKMYDSIESNLDKASSEPSTSNSVINMSDTSETKVQCLVCQKKILKSELNEHLEDCMSLSNIFDESKKHVEGVSEEKTRYNCPLCMELFSEGEMNDHIDVCLNICNK